MMGEFPIFRKVDRRKYGTHFAQGQGATRYDLVNGDTQDRGTVYTFPPLTVCRQTFSEMLQQPVEWGELTCWEGPPNAEGPPF
jgi:hypothetical protein